MITDSSGGSRTVEARLADGRPFVIGSNSDADLVLDNPTIGAPQCRFVAKGDRVVLENLDEEWGTFWNDARIDAPVAVSNGDRVEMGDLTVEIQIGSVTKTSAASEPPPAKSTPTPTATSAAPPASTSPRTPAGGTRPGRSTRARSYSWRPTNRPTTDPKPDPSPASEPQAGLAPAPPSAPSPAIPSVPEPAAPPPPTPSSTATPASAPTGGDDTQPVLQRAVSHLEAACPDALHALPDGRLDVLLTTGLRRATDFGLTADGDVISLIESMVLLNDEIDGPDCGTPDVWFAMTNEAKPAKARLERSLKIARKTWERRSAAPTSANSAPAVPAAPVSAIAPPPDRPDPPAIETIPPPTPTTVEPPAPAAPTAPATTADDWHLLEPDASHDGPRLFEHRGQWPRVDRRANVASTATICGDVTIGPGVRIHHGVTVVASDHPITIGEGSVILEGAILRASDRHGLRIGERVGIGSRAVLIGATIADGAVIDTGASVLESAQVGADAQVQISAIVSPDAAVPPGATVPPLHIASGNPAQALPAASSMPIPSEPVTPGPGHASDRQLSPTQQTAR